MASAWRLLGVREGMSVLGRPAVQAALVAMGAVMRGWVADCKFALGREGEQLARFRMAGVALRGKMAEIQ